MAGRKGFTLIELLIVLFIMGIIAAIALPNFMVSIEQSKAQTAQNNLLAISAAQSKYDEDYGGKYCLAGCADNKGLISQNLSVTFSADDPFTYSCAAASPSPYTCTAQDGTVTLTLNPNTNPTITCTAGGASCPSQ